MPLPSPCNTLPSVASRSAADFIAALGATPFHRVSWRVGTKGSLQGEFAAVRVRIADGPELRNGRHLPGSEVWLVCERRSNERKYYVTNHPADTPLAVLVAAIKGRWVCEQGHQQMKEELGLDHCECRNSFALHHHALLTMIAFCFLQHLRLGEKRSASPAVTGHRAQWPPSDSRSPFRSPQWSPPTRCAGDEGQRDASAGPPTRPSRAGSTAPPRRDPGRAATGSEGSSWRDAHSYRVRHLRIGSGKPRGQR